MSRAKWENFDPAALLPALAQSIPDPVALLAALLRAGIDDDPWKDGYHGRIAALVRVLIEGADVALLRDLLAALETALQSTQWSPKRIALAAVAACAETMPENLNLARPADLESLLVWGTREAESHSARRFGVTAISYLHTATPAAIAALLAASRDIPIVQQDAVNAAARFQHLSPDFGAEDALDPLTNALQSESAATAYIAARMLAALGSAPAAIQIPGLRQRIARILSQALRRADGERDVYLMEERAFGGAYIKHQGTLAQALFDALVQVMGLPE